MGVSLAVLASGCKGSLSTLDPAGPAARDIATLWWVMLAGSIAILALVLVPLGLAFRRGRPASTEADRTRFWIVQLGLGFTMTVLAALLAYGLVIGERLLPRAGADPVQVSALAERWRWTFAYAERPGAATVNVLHIPAGRPVDIKIESRDVIHSFWVPRLAGKLDAIPGHVNTLRLEADEPGEYAGQGAEYNGARYRIHRFTVIAHDAANWQAFIGGEIE